MTEKAAGADATGMQTRAVRDGDNWVLNGEKWFSSAASVADIAMRDGEDGPGRAAAPAVQHVPRRAAEPRLPDRAQHPDDGRREPRWAR